MTLQVTSVNSVPQSNSFSSWSQSFSLRQSLTRISSAGSRDVGTPQSGAGRQSSCPSSGRKTRGSRAVAEWQQHTNSRNEERLRRLNELMGIRGPSQFDGQSSANAGVPAVVEFSSIYCGTAEEAATASVATASTASVAYGSEPSDGKDAPMDPTETQPTGRLIRVIDPVKRTRRVETKRTVAAYLIGEGSQLENTLFRLAVQNWKTSRLLWSLWVSGAIIGLLTLLEYVSSELVWFSILMLPLPGFTFLVLSVDLLKEVIEQFEFYLISILQVALAVGAVSMLQDRRAVFWFCFSPTMIIATFVDAYPPRYRSRFSRMFFSAMIGMLIFWMCTLMFGLIRIRDMHWHLAYLQARGVSMSGHIMLTLTAFCCKHLFFAIRKPDQLVLVRHATRTMHVPVRIEEVTEGVDVEGNVSVSAKYVRVDRQNTNLSLN